MNVKVIKDSVIYKNEIIKIGKVFDCEEAVAKSLIDRGYVEAVRPVVEPLRYSYSGFL